MLGHLLPLLLVPHAAAAAANPNLRFLGFYTCVTPQVGNQCEEGFTLDQAGVATAAFSSNLTTIHRAAPANISTLFAVHDTFFANGVGLRTDWRQAWSRAQDEIEPLVQSGAIVGFFIGDELFPGKISLADFETCLAALAEYKAARPSLGLVTWENEGGTKWVQDFPASSGGIPAALDIISTDDYYMWANRTQQGDTPQAQVDGHRQFYKEQIYPLLHPHQRVFIVPGSFATRDPASHAGYPLQNRTYCYDGTAAGCDAYMAAQAEAYAAWAFADPLVAGVFPWHWDTRLIGVVTPYKEVGVVDMPKTRAAWKAIGARIRRGR